MNKHNLNTTKINNKPAFTIIEVVLVLAIAGLIFLMIFIALPALQSSQRDTQRKQQAQSIADAVTRLKANNRGTTGGTYASLSELLDRGYLKSEDILDPSTGELPARVLHGENLYTGYQTIRAGEYGYDGGGYCMGNNSVDISGDGGFASHVYVLGLEGGGWVCISDVMK